MDAIQKSLLEKEADLHEVPEGAYNIRDNGQKADRIIVLADGKVQKDGPRKDILPTLLGQTPDVCSALTGKIR